MTFEFHSPSGEFFPTGESPVGKNSPDGEWNDLPWWGKTPSVGSGTIRNPRWGVVTSPSPAHRRPITGLSPVHSTV